MNERDFSTRDTITIGLMMFALFLGAGNLIFPPALGQAAGTSVWIATIGFLVTGVGLPILAIIAIAKSGGDLQKISQKVGPTFAIFFPLAVYLAIGPLFGIPRTGSVAFEIGLFPYIGERSLTLFLFLFTLIFFGLSFWLSLNPSKLVGRIGKIITPIIVAILGLLTIMGISQPMGGPNAPIEGYEQFAFFQGFQEGYFTMDAIGALVFGIVIITRMKERGLTTHAATVKRATQVGIIAGTGLMLVYLSLAFLGATSVSIVGYQNNGGVILTGISEHLLGFLGLILLSIVITMACLTTSVGLISAFGEYVQKTIPKIPYPLSIGVVTLFSFLMSNLGLTQLLQFSLPMLIMLYPVAIVLVIMTIFKDLFHENSLVFKGAVLGAALISIPDGLSQTALLGNYIEPLITPLPLAGMGVAWIIPAIIGGVIGGFISNRWRMAEN
ncbi:LIVCS family branched-chain amino acid:cation transporter [Evansella vedderi]|uniref:Branched-chain amino acid transport system carrier protein n=1 Tax=Evansella vedderi TaxID=38282 RepID=A0ABT9ZUU5_9BACI|nr:branched-chain amino acid transport system II carrier protein [Evansella vedderi]MDQ0255014.1 LIVCS family branched-chain amino acid:cation transporter [Evansella vedderi]